MSKALVGLFKVNRTALKRNINLRTLTTQKHENVAIISTKTGDVAGQLQTSDKTGQSFFAFKGIPYAEQPIGELRFARPIPVEHWSGVKECFTDPPISIQPFPKVKCGEDCLNLNVYTPKNIVNGKLPVILFLHGGAFLFGSGNQDKNGPDFLLNENIIFVSANYRIGASGYLTTEDDVIPENNACRDQIIAMQWVKDNIERFGGDPNNITLYGQSAGATHVTHHLINPATEGLYNKAICHSGSILSRWAVNEDQGSTRRRAFKLGKLLGCDTKDSKELLKFLRKQNPMSILGAQFKCMNKEDSLKSPLFAFQILPERNELTPREKYERGLVNKVPTMMVSNMDEGFFLLNGFGVPRTPEETLAHYNKNPTDFVKLLFPLEAYSNGTAEECGRKVREYYFGNQEINLSTVRTFLNCLTDFGYNHGNYETGKFLAKAGSPVYLGLFNYDGELGLPRRKHSKTIPGCAHSDDLYYIFNITNPKAPPQLPENATEYLVRRQLVAMYTNFAKYGNPTPTTNELLPAEWPLFTPDNQVYMDITDNPAPKKGTFTDRLRLWDEVFAYGERKPNQTLDLREVEAVVDAMDMDEAESVAVAQ